MGGRYQIVLNPLGILQKAIIKIIDNKHKLYSSYDLFIDTKYFKIKIYLSEIVLKFFYKHPSDLKTINNEKILLKIVCYHLE